MDRQDIADLRISFGIGFRRASPQRYDVSQVVPNPDRPSIPDYEVIRRVGRGSYGEVWLVKGVTGIYRAAKVVWRDRFRESAPFEREFNAVKAYAGVSLRDPSLLRVVHVGRDNAADCFYYVMELADNAAGQDPGPEMDPEAYEPRTLRSDKENRGRLSPRETIRVGISLAQALRCLHGLGLVHRDIKPSNIIWVNGTPKLGDIGLVTDIQEGATRVGTEGYIPPEGPGKPSADVYGLGMVLYEMCTGRDVSQYPFLAGVASDPEEVSAQRELNEIILKATNRSAAERYISAEGLLRDLELVEAGSSVKGWLKLRRQARWLKVAAAVLLSVAAFAIFIAWSQQRLTRAARAELSRARYAAANLELNAGHYHRSRRILEQLWPEEPALAPPYWRMLYREAYGEPERVYRESTNRISQLAISPDARAIVALDANSRITVFNTETNGKFPLPGTALGLIPSSTRPARHAWIDQESGEIRAEPAQSSTPPGQFSTAGGAPGSDFFFTIPQKEPLTVEIRRQSDLSLVRRLEIPVSDHWKYTRSFALDASGSHLAFLRYQRTGTATEFQVEIWDTHQAKPLLLLPHRSGSYQIALSADGQRTALALGTVAPPEVWDWSTSNRVELRSDREIVAAHTIAIEPSGRRVAAGCTDGVVRIYDATSGALLDSLVGSAPEISSIVWSMDGQFIVTGDDSGEIRRWDVSHFTPRPKVFAGFSTSSLCDLVAAPGGRAWAASYGTNDVAVWWRGEEAKPHTVLNNAGHPLRFDPGSKQLWTADAQVTVRRWDLETANLLQETKPLVPSAQEIGGMAINAGGTVAFAIGYESQRLYRFDLSPAAAHHAQQSLVVDTPIRGSVNFLLSPDDTRLVALGPDGKVICWDATSLAVRWEYPGFSASGQKAGGIAISRDGKRLAAGSGTGHVQVFEAAQGRLLHTYQPDSSRALALAFSRDGKFLVASHTSGQISWYDLDAGELVARFQLETYAGVHEAAHLWRMVVTGDGEELLGLTNGRFPMVRRWSIGPQKNL